MFEACIFILQRGYGCGIMAAELWLQYGIKSRRTHMLRSPSLKHVWISTLNALALSLIDLHFHCPTFHVPWACCRAQDHRTAKLCFIISRLQGVTTPWLLLGHYFSTCTFNFQLTSRLHIDASHLQKMVHIAFGFSKHWKSEKFNVFKVDGGCSTCISRIIQRTYFGARIKQCRKPFVPNYFGIILNYLVTFQIFWYRTKEITQGVLNLTNWVRLYSNQASHRCIFIRMCTPFLTPRTLADNVRLISRAQHLGCKPDGTCWLKCGVV